MHIIKVQEYFKKFKKENLQNKNKVSDNIKMPNIKNEPKKICFRSFWKEGLKKNIRWKGDKESLKKKERQYGEVS